MVPLFWLESGLALLVKALLARQTKAMEMPLCQAQELAAQYYWVLAQETGLLVMDYPLPALVLVLPAMARLLPFLMLGLPSAARPLPDFQLLLLMKSGLP